MWGLALRYAAAAVKPVAKGAALSAKSGVKERVAAATSSDHSLKDRLNPSTTEKGGKVGDAADALLEKMGKPGKLAAKASLGSRVVGRLAPGTTDDTSEPEPAAESEEPADEATEASEEPADESAAPAAESDSSGSDAELDDQAEEAEEDEPDEDQVEEAEEDEPDDTAAESDATDGHLKSVEPHSEPVRTHPGADPLHTDFDHAYSEEVENYEHRDAYANTR